MPPKNLAPILLAAVVVGCGMSPPVEAGRMVSPDPEAYFITQYTNPRYHPQPAPADNANCGPTSLAMAIKAFDKVPSELSNDPEALIMAVRQALTGARDAGCWTYPAQFPAAARAFGLEAQIVRGGAAAVLQQLAIPGRMVVVNLNPAPAYVDRLAIPYSGGHFALATGVDNGKIRLSDPLAPGPLTITAQQLQTALETPLGQGIAPFGGGVAVWANN